MLASCLRAVGLTAVLEAVAVAVHLQDIDMVSETIEESSGQPLGCERRWSGSWKIAGDCVIDINLGDVETVRGDPSVLTNWARLAQ